jgi:hypothetical protein
MSSKVFGPTRILLGIALLLFASAAFGQALQQIVTPNPTGGAFAGNGAAVAITAVYTSDGPAGPHTTTGLGVRLHWDSTALTFVNLTSLFTSDLAVDPMTIAPEADGSNFDGDADTDMFVNVAWFDISGQWPAGPTNLYTANFTTTPGYDGTVTHFTSSGPAAGHTFVGNDFTGTGLPTATPTNTPTVSPTPSDTPTPSNTPTASNTPTPSNTPTNTLTPSITPTPSNTPIASATPSIIAPRIPTLSGTGIALMVLLMLGIAAVYLARQRN